MSVNAVFKEARCAQYEFSLTMPASVARVWHALIHQLNAWWLTSLPRALVAALFQIARILRRESSCLQ